MADAVKDATDRHRALAAVSIVMGRPGAEVFTVLEQGSALTEQMMDSITVAKDETVKAIEEINDKLTELKTLAAGTFANLFVGLIDGAVEVGEIIGKAAAIIETKIPPWALASPALMLNPLTWILGGGDSTTGEIMAGIEARGKQNEDEKDRKEKEKEERVKEIVSIVAKLVTSPENVQSLTLQKLNKLWP